MECVIKFLYGGGTGKERERASYDFTSSSSANNYCYLTHLGIEKLQELPLLLESQELEVPSPIRQVTHSAIIKNNS